MAETMHLCETVRCRCALQSRNESPSRGGKTGRTSTNIVLLVRLCLVSAGFSSQAAAQDSPAPLEVIYANASGAVNGWHSSSDEYGDEVLLSGHYRSIAEFQFEYFGDFVAQGDETCTIRFYKNDGESDQDFLKPPGTLIYESKPFSIHPGFHLVSVSDIDAEVPNRITWAADFDGLSGLGGDCASLVFRDAPTVGVSLDYIWKKWKTGVWEEVWFNGRPTANFSARIYSHVDLSVAIQVSSQKRTSGWESSPGAKAKRSFRLRGQLASVSNCNRPPTSKIGVPPAISPSPRGRSKSWTNPPPQRASTSTGFSSSPTPTNLRLPPQCPPKR